MQFRRMRLFLSNHKTSASFHVSKWLFFFAAFFIFFFFFFFTCILTKAVIQVDIKDEQLLVRRTVSRTVLIFMTRLHSVSTASYRCFADLRFRKAGVGAAGGSTSAITTGGQQHNTSPQGHFWAPTPGTGALSHLVPSTQHLPPAVGQTGGPKTCPAPGPSSPLSPTSQATRALFPLFLNFPLSDHRFSIHRMRHVMVTQQFLP